MAQRGAFSCAFTRRNCSHDKLFHDEYQRTNRTKENKILRCFPHCCPDHVRRSYCGSSLHLQVDFHAGDGALAQPARDDDLLVFGRFRPLESRALAVGDRLAGATILSSLQSEDNPTGEWIEAWLVASADQNAWLYEVNHAARWYYNWGSSAAKDKRLKQHVIEVCVLHQPREAGDAFQVAAVSCSPPFKLLSFRRAPADGRRRGQDESAEQLSLSEEDAAALKLEEVQRPKAAPTSRGLLETSSQRWSTPRDTPRHSIASSWEDEEKAPQAAPYEPPPLVQPPRHRLAPPFANGVPHVRLPSLMLREATSSPCLKRARPASFVHEPLGSMSARSSHSPVLSWPHGPRESTSDETRSASPAIQRGSLTQLEELTIIVRFLRALPLATVVAHMPTLEAEFRSHTVSFGANAPSPAASSHVKRLLHELGESPQLRQLQRPLDPALVAVAARLSLWLQCDPDLQRSRESMHQQAASALLVKPVVLETHERYVRWLHHQTDAFLARCGWSLETFVAAVSQTDPAPSAGYSRGTTVAFADFVAQAREQFVARQEASGPAIRRRLHRLSVQSAPSPSRPSRLAGVWRSELSSVHLRRLGPVEPVPLDAVLWFWRQLSCVAVTLKPASAVSATALEVKSAFATSESVLRLVLDGRARWFRSFPAGEASGATAVGGQSFGDYQAMYKPSLDTIECAMYSWPTGTASAAFRWRWQLTPTASRALLVQLVVERGSLVSLPAETETLAHKCSHVSRWDRVALADWTIES